MHLFFTLPMTQLYLPMTQSFTQDINKLSYAFNCMYKPILLPKYLNFHQCIIKFSTHDSIFILPMHQHTNFTMHQPSIIPMVHPQIVLCITLLLTMVLPHHFLCIILFTSYGSPSYCPLHLFFRPLLQHITNAI